MSKAVKFTASDNVAKVLEQIPKNARSLFINNCIVEVANANPHLLKWCSQQVKPRGHARDFSSADLDVLPGPKKSKVKPTPALERQKHDFSERLKLDDEFG